MAPNQPKEKDTISIFSFVPFCPSIHISFDDYLASNYVILGHFTTSVFLEKILDFGLLPANKTNMFSNIDMFINGDDEFVYLAGHFDHVFSQNAIKKFGGEEILLIVKIERSELELDDLLKHHSKQNRDIQDHKQIYKILTQDIFSQCRTKSTIPPENILHVLSVDKILNNMYLSSEKRKLKAFGITDIEEHLESILHNKALERNI